MFELESTPPKKNRDLKSRYCSGTGTGLGSELIPKKGNIGQLEEELTRKVAVLDNLAQKLVEAKK